MPVVGRLPNGLRVVTDRMGHVRTASVGVWVDAGSRYEQPPQNGIAHMLEHMAFKGTERRSARDIAEEIESVGGHLNAYTSREQTAYYARVLGRDMPLALDMIADILLHSSFEHDEFEKERKVVIQEIGQVNDTPDDVLFDLLQERAYPGQALGRSILGTEDLVGKFSRADLAGFLDEHYSPDRMVLVAAGEVDHDAVMRDAERLFGGMRSKPRGRPEPAAFSGGEYREVRDLDQAHITFALPGVGYKDPDFFPMQIFTTLLGGGMSSRLFQEVRENLGLAYNVAAYCQSYLDGGLFSVYAGTASSSLEQLMPVLAEQLCACAEKVGEEEVARAKVQLKVGMLMGLESSGTRAEQMGRHMLIHDRCISPEELEAKIDAVDARAVERVAEGVIKAGKPAIAALGPIQPLEGYDQFAARLG